MTIADRIRQKRHELHLSQSELADRAEYYDKTRISKIENSGNDISMKQVKRIANALGVSSAYLMGWEDENGEKTSFKRYIEYKEVAERLDSYNLEQIIKALDFLDAYQSAGADARAMVETLLKSHQSDS